MLGHNLPQGSEAISFHNTLFRVSELCWIKAVKLTIPELVIRVLAVVLGVVWVFAMKSAKGTFVNVEFLLAIFPLLLAWNTAGSLKIGCSGDFEEEYEGRRGLQSSLFKAWIETLRKREPDWLHLQSGSYDLLLNPHRVAWIKPCFQWKVFPLVVIGVFAGYMKLLSLGLVLDGYPVLDEFEVLSFDGGTGTVSLLSWGIIAIASVAFALSFKRSVQICGTGGVQDIFPLTAADQASVLGILSGEQVASTKKVVEKRPAPKQESKNISVLPVSPDPKPSGPDVNASV